MGKIQIIASIRPFIDNERPDEAVRVEDGVLSLEDPRNLAQRFQYKYVFLIIILTRCLYAILMPLNREFASCYDQSVGLDGIKVLFENEIKARLDGVFDGKVRCLTLNTCKLTDRQ